MLDHVRTAVLAAAAIAGSSLVGGCASVRETQPPRTATEQLLISHAAEVAAERLAGALPKGATIFIDAASFKGDDADYALSAIRGAVLKQGSRLAEDRQRSEITVELRLGALSIDQKDATLGLPGTYLPIPGTASVVPIPEISVFSTASRKAVAELSAFAYSTQDLTPIAFVGPIAGERELRQTKVLSLFVFGSRMEKPHDVGPR